MRRESLLRRFVGDRGGVAAVEFAFIAPVMILAYFGVAELCGAMLAERKAYHAASAIGDLVTQQSTLSVSDINDIFTVANTIMLPYSSTGMNMRVTSLQLQSSGSYMVTWSCGQGGYTAYAKNSTYASSVPGNLIQSNQSMVLAEVQYVYNSPVQYIIPNAQTYTEKFYLRPRRVDPIPDPGAGSGCT